MDKKEFKIWLIKNDYTQKSLAKKLQISERTISNYVRDNNFSFVFVLALVALEHNYKLEQTKNL